MGAETKPSPTTPRRVLLIGNYPADRQYSMRRYADELARNLAGLGIEVRLIAPRVLLGRLAFGHHVLAKWLGHLDKYLLFPPRLLIRRGYDLAHVADQANAVYRRWPGRRPVVVTCHDLIAIRTMLGEIGDHRERRTGSFLQRKILKSLRQCEAVICTSQATHQDVVRLLAPNLVGTIPNAIAGQWAPLPPDQASVLLAQSGIDPEQSFFLHVGGNQFYKNRRGVVRLFDHLAAMPQFADHRLVLAGKAPDAKLHRTIGRSPHVDRIVVLETPSDAILRALYSQATALLFPSFHEGFGWPIVEAQACGCIVVTTDREPMRTVGGDAAILIDPDDLPRATTTIVAGLATASARRERGLANAGRYRPPSIYPDYVDFYAAAMANYREDKR